MRFHAKLFAAVAVFVLAARLSAGDMLGELSFDVRAAYALQFGSTDDLNELLDECEHAHAAKCGELDAYFCGQEYRRLLAERLAAAECLDGSVSEEEYGQIREDCAARAFARMRRPEPYAVAAAESCPRP